MSDEVPRDVPGQVSRCPHCGAIQGGAGAALDALYREVARLSRLAQEAQDREADLRREIRLLRETVARLRGGSGTLTQDRYVTET